MNEKAFENVLEVRDEAHGMLENLAKVKGEKYARLVKALLLSSNVMEIHAATSSIGGLPDDARAILGDAMCRAVCGLFTSLSAAAEFTVDELNSATRDATAMEASISTLMKDAVRAGLKGSSFGDRGAK